MNLYRDIPVKMFEKLNKFGRPDIIIKVDKCLLRGFRKNHIIHYDGWRAYNGIAQYG